jgi:hypothetical protein
MNKLNPMLVEALEQADMALTELLQAARSEAGAETAASGGNSNRQAAEVAELASMPGGMLMLRAFIYEVLSAFGACAFEMVFDDAGSRGKIVEFVTQQPCLQWALDGYLADIALEDLNPTLSDPGARATAHARLNAWLS